MVDISFFDKVKHYKEIDSTFAEAKRLIKARKIAGNFLLTADKQTEGVGRKGNIWLSPVGGLWVTAGISKLPVKSSITIFTALMIVKTVIKQFPETEDYIGIKWPNDILIDGKKMGGILTSNFPMYDYLLIGIGLNTNNSSPEDYQAVSLSDALTAICPDKSRKQVDHHLLLSDLFDAFGNDLPNLLEEGLNSFLQEYYRYSLLENKEIILRTEFQDYHGTVKGLNNEGALLVKLDSGFTQPFLSGSVVQWS